MLPRRRAPRGSRKKDDAQWARFKAAQDTFFAARNAGGATEGMLNGLLNEFPGYIPAARKAGLIR